jgi:hypothetical protein
MALIFDLAWVLAAVIAIYIKDRLDSNEPIEGVPPENRDPEPEAEWDDIPKAEYYQHCHLVTLADSSRTSNSFFLEEWPEVLQYARALAQTK